MDWRVHGVRFLGCFLCEDSMIDISFSRLPVMRNRFARGAMLIILALAVAFVAYRFVLYNSSEAKRVRFVKSIERELQPMKPIVDSLKELDIKCAEKNITRLLSARGNFVRSNCNSLDSLPFKFRYDSLDLYRKLSYDCKKMSDYFTMTKRPERLPSFCKK